MMVRRMRNRIVDEDRGRLGLALVTGRGGESVRKEGEGRKSRDWLQSMGKNN